MNDSTLDLDQTENEILTDDVSDETLEAAGMRDTPTALPCTAPPFIGPTFGAGHC
jgi:hypothetical protein